MTIRRSTVQRQIILDTFVKLNIHPTVDEVYIEVHKNHPTISKTTVYRNLQQLADSNVIRQVLLPSDLVRYDRRIDKHYHFKCKNCGGIFDVDIDYLDGLNETVRQKYGFQVDAHDVVFTGVCSKCGGTESP